MWEGRAEFRCRCGHGRAEFRCRCGRGEPSPNADVAAVQKSRSKGPVAQGGRTHAEYSQAFDAEKSRRLQCALPCSAVPCRAVPCRAVRGAVMQQQSNVRLILA